MTTKNTLTVAQVIARYHQGVYLREHGTEIMFNDLSGLSRSQLVDFAASRGVKTNRTDGSYHLINHLIQKVKSFKAKVQEQSEYRNNKALELVEQITGLGKVEWMDDDDLDVVFDITGCQDEDVAESRWDTMMSHLRDCSSGHWHGLKFERSFYLSSPAIREACSEFMKVFCAQAREQGLDPQWDSQVQAMMWLAK